MRSQYCYGWLFFLKDFKESLEHIYEFVRGEKEDYLGSLDEFCVGAEREESRRDCHGLRV